MRTPGSSPDDVLQERGLPRGNVPLDAHGHALVGLLPQLRDDELRGGGGGGGVRREASRRGGCGCGARAGRELPRGRTLASCFRRFTVEQRNSNIFSLLESFTVYLWLVRRPSVRVTFWRQRAGE